MKLILLLSLILYSGATEFLAIYNSTNSFSNNSFSMIQDSEGHYTLLA